LAAITDQERRPRRGRQAEAERNDRLVLDAAREVFATQGFDAPVSAVARRAGVGMGSLYRRYGSKVELLQRLCMLAMEQAIEAAETAVAAEDPWSGLVEYVRTCVAFGSGAFTPLAGTFQTTPDMWRASRRGRDLVETLVARAQRDGCLRPDVTALDVAWLVEQFSMRRAAPPSADDDNVQRRLLAIALDGLRAPQPESLPGVPPSADHYEGRWRYRGSPADPPRNHHAPS
jgi:AcrR family transcriptional regulator